MLVTIEDAVRKIETGQPLVLAASEEALARMPRGNWIGGTIPYFMHATCVSKDESRVFVTEMPIGAKLVSLREYTTATIGTITTEAPENGFSVLIIPAGSPIHEDYARGAPGYKGIYTRPIVGWISGTAVEDIGKRAARVFSGRTGQSSTTTAVCLHVAVPKGKMARLGIVNIFKPGAGDAIAFPEGGFSVTRCEVNGKQVRFADYLKQKKIDTKLPLVADYSGVNVNVSFQSVDEASGAVRFYAPVFTGVRYSVAAPVANYVDAFSAAIGELPRAHSAFACNCILNYLYGALEGKKIPVFQGPITFGEIAYQLLNQTLVYMEIIDT